MNFERIRRIVSRDERGDVFRDGTKKSPGQAGTDRKIGRIGVGLFAIVVLCAVGCRESGRSRLESDLLPRIAYAVKRGEIAVSRIGLTPNPPHNLYGRILEIKLRNLTDREARVQIDAGTVLRSDVPGFAEMVVTTPETTILPPKGEWTHTLEVYSIAFAGKPPGRNVNYTIGNLVGGDVAQLVTCLGPDEPDPLASPIPSGVRQLPGKPGEPPTFVVPSNVKPAAGQNPPEKRDLMPVQLAIWRITDGKDRDALLKDVAGNPEMKGGDYGASIRLYNEMGPYVQKLLSECRLDQYKF